MHAIQGPFGEEDFGALYTLFPRESMSLFGNSVSLLKNSDSLTHAQFLAKKHDMATRLDICCSQMLGFAVTSIKSIIILAVKNGGHFFDVLARSLNIGFLVSLQSMLSTYGDEMGMVEDLEMATSWLGLLTVRFTQKPRPLHTSSSKQILSTLTLNDKSKASSAGGGGSKQGKIDRGGLSLRRDDKKRLILDIEIDNEEAAVVLAAIESMQNFPLHADGMHHDEEDFSSPQFEKISDITAGLVYSSLPICSYNKYESAPAVIAVASVIGVTFTQGVNEMQTLASVSSHASVQKQCEINNYALEKVKEYHRLYRAAILFQCENKDKEKSQSGQSKGESRLETAKSGNSSANNRFPHRRFALTRDASDKISSEGMSEFARLRAESKRLLSDVEEALRIAEKSPGDKHVHVLMKFSALCREMGGVMGILCKSGKDRTGMGVTLDIARGLVEDLGVTNGKEACSLLRTHGVRRINVFANTGQSLFAFNDIQRMALPVCFRPPHSTYSGKVNS
jgi:inositol polyphosphate-4-phosphatase